MYKDFTTDSYVNTTGIITASQFWSNGELVTGSQATTGTQGPYGFQGYVQGPQAPTSQGTQGPYGFHTQGYKVSTTQHRKEPTSRVPSFREFGVQGLQGPQGKRALKVKTEPQ